MNTIKMVHIFKIWSQNRADKISLAIASEDDLFDNVINKACTKLGILSGIEDVRLVLEKDGTVVDDVDVLVALQEEVFIILRPDEIWTASTVLLLPRADSPFNESESSTISIVSDTNQSMTQKTVDESFWLNYQIPWKRFGNDIFATLERGGKEKQIKLDVVPLIIADMRDQSKNLSSKVLKSVAKKMVQEYPQTFQDLDDEGNTFGDGSHTVFTKLLHRNNYCKRISGNEGTKRSSSYNCTSDTQQNRRKLSNKFAKAGCQNWQPEMDTSQDINSSLEYLKTCIDDCIPEEQILEHLEKTYPVQRSCLNNPNQLITDILENWKILFKTPYTFWHMEKLTNRHPVLIKNGFKEHGAKIQKFGVIKKIIPISETQLSETEIIERCLIVISKYFKEDLEKLLISQEDGTPLTDVAKKIYTSSPVITRVNGTYYIYIEKINIHGVSSLLEAVQHLMSCYYILNLKYVQATECTLEFLQRFFLKIHPECGTKGKAVNKGKIMGLYNKLKEFEMGY